MQFHQWPHPAQDDQHRGLELEHSARARDSAAADLGRTSRGTSKLLQGIIGDLAGLIFGVPGPGRSGGEIAPLALGESASREQ
jgi:hypothetical protein